MENELGKTNNQKRTIWLGITILAILLLVGGGYLLYTKNVEKNVFKATINELFDGVIEKTSGKKSTNMNLKLNITSNNNEYKDILDIINKMEIKADLQMDYDSSNFNEKIIINYDNKLLLNTDLCLRDQDIFILLNNVYDKYIKISAGDTNTNNLSNEFTTLLESLKKSFINSLKDTYFKTTTENGMEKTTLALSGKVVSEISISIVNDLSKDTKFIEALAKITSITKEEAESNIKSLLAELKDTDTSDYAIFDDVTVSIYTKSNKIVKAVIELIDSKITMTINKNNYYIEGISDNKKIFNINIEVDNDHYMINYNDESGIRFTLNADVLVEDIKKIDDIDVANSVLYEELTEEDMNAIITKLSENKTIAELIEKLK